MNLKNLVNRSHPLAVKIRKQITQALSEFNMISENDKIMVCVSGGKDSSILLILLDEIRKRAELNFSFEAVLLDQKQPGFSADAYKSWLQSEGLNLTIIEKDTYSIVIDKIKDGVYCSLCSKLRRAILYDFSFSRMEEKGLMSTQFITIHKSYRVNAEKIKRYISASPNHLVEVDVCDSEGKTKIKNLPVSENYQKDLRKYR